ncbi:MAG: alpha/beta hydrolase [Hyphomicrobiales bacterium]|nr:alpha/beta hydrolase [Hyphomicrobiales bacterium]
MSPSDPRIVFAQGRSSHADPADALREGLSELLGALAREGATPGDIAGLTLTAPEPQGFHLSRREIDGAWREVCGGLRRPLRYARGGTELTLRAEAHVRQPIPALPVWRGMSVPEIARAYSPRQQADMQGVFRRWNHDGALARAGQTGLDLAYGPSRDESLDFVAARDPRAPVWVFLHGGYWQACTKDQHGQFAEGMLRHGFAFANLDYGLAPETPLTEIVLQVRRALTFLVGQADALGFDPARLHLAGHSAGAQLAGMAALDEKGPPVRSALLLSGVFDLAPIAHLPMGPMIGLEGDAMIRSLSPMSYPAPSARIGVALGGLETDEFKRQSREMAEAWGAPAPLVVAGRHHFDLLEDLRAESELLDLALRTAAD